MTYYDLVIVGAGPSGLAFAHCCSQLNKKILVIDRENTIGGCHRVKRVNGLFTEHGPRVYLANYINLFKLLQEIGLDVREIFTKYKQDDYSKILPYFEFNDLLILVYSYFNYFINPNYGYNKNLNTFCIEEGFSKKSIEVLNKLCRYIDGAGINKYSLNKFLQMSDSMTTILQPTGPLDKILFEPWQKYLEKNGVDFILSSELSAINTDNNKIDNIIINQQKIYLDKLILAIPPASIKHILKDNKNIKNCFGNYEAFHEWAEETEYIEYISITYHFKDDIIIPSVNAMTFDTEWGIICINISDYMKSIEPNYKKVISLAITIADKPSKATNKTANQSSANELIKEAYRQIKTSVYPNLPDNYYALINPNNYYHKNKWNSKDEAYFNTINTKRIPFYSSSIINIYNLGPHNGHSYMDFTTMETATSNGIALAYNLFPELKTHYKLKNYWKITDKIRLFILLICICLFVSIIYIINS